MEDGNLIIHHGWLELMSESSVSTWGKISMKKPWKKRFIVLKQSSSNSDEIFLAVYDKDDQWRRVEPKRSFNLYPRYKIAKLTNFKGKDNVLEVDNENERWHFSSDKLKVIDLWACQIQMQTKLSRAISGRIFSVSGAVHKDMQRIGAAQQRCLLHFTQWGVTLALQESRSVLAMWPLKCIRNYEDSGQCEFTIEAGRRSPMGEGVFKFYSNIGQDREMFNIIDAFVNALLNEQASINPTKKPTTDEDILKTYDQLYKSAIGFNAEPPRPKVSAVDTVGYSHIGGMAMRGSTPLSSSISRDLSIHKPPDYNGLYDTDFVELDQKDGSPNDSLGSPRGLSFSDDKNYDKLSGRNQSWGATSSQGERNQSWGATSQGEYDHIHQKTNHAVQENTYDRINRFEQGFKPQSHGASTGIVGYPLHNEASIPCLDTDDSSFKGRSSISSTPGDEFIFRNSIYSPLGSSAGNNNSQQRRLTGESQDLNPNLSMRHDSTASEGGGMHKRQSASAASFRDKSHKDIADHFMYAVPSSLTSQNSFGHTKEGEPIRGGLVDPTLTGDIYQNSESLIDETSFVTEARSSGGNIITTAKDKGEAGKKDIASSAVEGDIYENTESILNNDEMYQNSESVRD